MPTTTGGRTAGRTATKLTEIQKRIVTALRQQAALPGIFWRPSESGLPGNCGARIVSVFPRVHSPEESTWIDFMDVGTAVKEILNNVTNYEERDKLKTFAKRYVWKLWSRWYRRELAKMYNHAMVYATYNDAQHSWLTRDIFRPEDGWTIVGPIESPYSGKPIYTAIMGRSHGEVLAVPPKK